MLSILVYHNSRVFLPSYDEGEGNEAYRVHVGGGEYSWLSYPYRLLLFASIESELPNYIFLLLTAYYEGTHPAAGSLSARDIATLLLVLEVTYIFDP